MESANPFSDFECIRRWHGRAPVGDATAGKRRDAFDDYRQFHLMKEYERTHHSRYADRTIPNPLPKPRSHLRLVR